MFQPITRSARIAKLAYQFRARFGRAGWIAGRRICLDGRPGFLAAFDRPGLVCAYFTGTNGPHRKTTAQIMTPEGEIVGYAKISRNPLVKPFINTEARVLQNLAGLALKTAAVPDLLDFRTASDAAWLATDTQRAPGHVVAQEFTSPHRAFLAELAEKTEAPGLMGTLRELANTFENLRPKLGREWATRLESGIEHLIADIDMQPAALAHGDFTPWNSFIVGERLYVFDWEYAHPAYPLGYDQVHFMLATNPVTPALTLLTSLESEIAATWFNDDLRSAARAILFSLLLHATFYLNRAIKAGGTVADWTDAGRRAKLIETVLARLNG
jgi:hypothetical protein